MIFIPRDNMSPLRWFYRNGRGSGFSARGSKWNSDRRADERVHVNIHVNIHTRTYTANIRTKRRTTSRCKHKRYGVVRRGETSRARRQVAVTNDRPAYKLRGNDTPETRARESASVPRKRKTWTRERKTSKDSPGGHDSRYPCDWQHVSPPHANPTH